MTDPAQPWQSVLTNLADRYGVVGASFAVHHRGELNQAVTGVLNVRTGQPVTANSVFQVGSLTKLWTATQVMFLVEAGRLDLDAPVRDAGLLPDQVLDLVGYDGGSVLLAKGAAEEAWRPAAFFELGGDRYLHAGAHAFRRVEGSGA